MTGDAPAWYVSSAIEALATHKGKIALSYRGHDLGYSELLADVYRTARALRRSGLRRGDGLALVAGNRPEAFVIRFAAFLLGLRFTPVVPGLTDPRYVAEDSGAAALICAAPVDVDVPLVLTLDDVSAAARTEPDDPLPVAAQEQDIARVLYTSGTTGRPKGVPSSYAALGASTRSWGSGTAEMPEGMRFLLVTPFAHGSGDAAMNMLRFGVTVEIFDGFDTTEFVAAVQRSPMAMSFLYPSWLYRLLDHADADLSALRLLSYGSSPIAPARLRQALERFGPILVQTYASTEAAAIAMLDAADHAVAMDDRPELLASVGRPLPGIAVELRAEDGTPVPTGEVGEVCVKGASVMPGYWNRPELTAAALRDGWLHTGDLGRFDADGYLYLVGRIKDIIIVNGYNHYAGPIEDALTSHPAVREAAVVGSPDDRTGEAIHAFVVARAIDAEQLRAWAQERLTADALPATFTFLDTIPTTPQGKPDKKALREQATRLHSAGERADRRGQPR
ncbi:AMP-binding protein [Allokutzneria albata]|uniref:Fatty-acyl-CoA synthase n=1 Tax=Allokutzneria albata TaxID=211114 RepID=A0A1G9S3G4_ALLAB|nr:AMP-binding protein [Allokutzneria albata]SDM30039.1 fatty-acyl-CoA synthase [Allokutzneria albata]